MVELTHRAAVIAQGHGEERIVLSNVARWFTLADDLEQTLAMVWFPAALLGVGS